MLIFVFDLCIQRVVECNNEAYSLCASTVAGCFLSEPENRMICYLYISGLAEVLHGSGSDRLDKLMPDVIKTTLKEDLAPHVREGYLMLYIYLPATFGDEFAKYVAQIVPSLLKVYLSSLAIHFLHCKILVLLLLYERAKNIN